MIKNLCLLVFLALNLQTLTTTASEQESAMLNPNNWAHPRGQHNNQGYSDLNQIDKNNIKDLKLAWTFSTGVNRGHEGAPLVIDDIMYVHTAFPNNVYALDLNNNQRVIWSYLPKQEPSIQRVMCCDSVNRGLGYGDGKIYLQQNDGTLIALNAKTGKVTWQVQVNDPKTGATNTNAPQVIKDKVLTGCAGGEFGVRCFIAAYFLKDGALAWKAYSTGSDADILIDDDFNKTNPQYSALKVYKDIYGGNRVGGSFERIPNNELKTGEKELGIRTWVKPQQEKDGWQNGGGSVTGYFSFDAKTNLVYYGTGNPGVWNPDVRPGDNKWTSSVFARDVDTGKAKWAMQTTPHDEWDYDANNEIILFDSDRFGKNKLTYATQVNKNGFIYTWQPDNGKLLATGKVHPYVSWATDVDLKTGVPNKNAKFSTHQDYNTRGVCPSSYGARGVGPAAFSPNTGLIYVPLNHLCMSYNPVQSNYVAGNPWVGATLALFAGPDDVMGGFAAYDPLSTKHVWYNREKFSVVSGALATRSNLVFYGTLDRWLKAVDAETGEELWSFPMISSVIGNTFAYGHKGKQYIGVLTSSVSGWLNQGGPSNFGLSSDDYKRRSDTNSDIPEVNKNKGSLDIFSL